MTAELSIQCPNLNSPAEQDTAASWQSFGQFYGALVRVGATAKAKFGELWKDEQGCIFDIRDYIYDDGKYVYKGTKIAGISQYCGRPECEKVSQGMIHQVEITSKSISPSADAKGKK